MRTLRFVCCLGIALGGSALPAAAQSDKQQDCLHQAQVVAAVQNARKDRVEERRVQEHLAARAQPWPENYAAMIPLVTPWVYETPISDIREKNLATAWRELCLQQ